MAGLNIDQILRDLERQKTAEETFVEGLQGKPVEIVATPTVEVQTEKVAEAPVEVVAEIPAEVPAEKVAEVVPEVVAETPTEVVAETVIEKTAEELELEKVAEMEKEAAELDAKGRIMARAFIDELQKLASDKLSETAEQVLIDTPVEETEKVAEDPRVWILTNLYNEIYK